MKILDTQIISYAFKNAYKGQIYQQRIASTTAKEFLLVQGEKRTKANYYIPLPNCLKKTFTDADVLPLPKRDHPFSKHATDQIILEFGQDYPAVIEFSNLAIAEIINIRAKPLFNEAIRFLNKEKRKIIMQRFNFLLDFDVKCIPLSRKTTELGLDLFYEFLSRYNTKQNVKNTINDVFILATAINSSATLITQDSLLNRFASEYFNGELTEKSGVFSIDFCKGQDTSKCTSRESKGYINKGWQVRVYNYKGAW